MPKASIRTLQNFFVCTCGIYLLHCCGPEA